VALFSDDDRRHDSESEIGRTSPPRSVVIGWVLLGVAFVLALCLALVPAPYVIEQPGPAFNTLATDRVVGQPASTGDKPLITIPGQKTYPTSGALDLLTVSVVGNPQALPSWMEVASAWFDPSKAVLPVDAVYPPGQTSQQSDKANQTLMIDSQKDAIAAALNKLGYHFPQAVAVKQVAAGYPAVGVLKVGDEIVSVNGKPVAGVQSLRDALAKNGVGKPAQIGIVRAKAPQTVTITPVKSGTSAVLGIGVGMDYTFPFTVSIQLNNVGGPSAGQMFALGIIDKLTPGSLNGGKKVAGTGTIDNEGNVGAIGGIRQKMFAARSAGATWFLAPSSNCDEVTGHIPGGLKVVAVKTLDNSLAALKAISTGANTASLPTCPVG
jgi:PDZ domain-containing protein